METHNEVNTTEASLADEIKQPATQVAIWLRLQAYSRQMREEC